MPFGAYTHHLTLGALLETLRVRAGGYSFQAHFQQGEFHHDTVLKVDAARAGLPGSILVVATNCNGGIKELLCFNKLPSHGALWHRRCPDNAAFSGELPSLLAAHRTIHWFDPCELLSDDARSELRPEFRERLSGGGYRLKPSCKPAAS
jgi:hypothetical protein